MTRSGVFAKFVCFSAAVAAFAWAGTLRAQPAFPSKPITIIVPFGAGGSTDVSTRALGEAAGRLLGQPVVVENRPGGSGAVAISALRLLPADGHALLIMGSTQIANQFLSDVAYNVERDLTPVVLHMSYHAGLAVRADSPWKTFRDFIAHVKANPGKVSYASAAAGTPQHLVMERLTREIGASMIFAPFGDGTKAVNALLGGHVDSVSQVTEWKPHVEAGTLRLLVTYGTKRMPQFPEVPTLIDLGYNITNVGFNSIVALKATPPERVAALARAFKTVLDNPNSEFAKVLTKFDLVGENLGPAEATAYFRKFETDTRAILSAAGIGKKP